MRTPSKDALTLPHNKHHLAAAIALEWDSLVSAQQALKQHYIPLTSLTARAQDIERADRDGDPSIRESAVNTVMGYLRTDTLLCWAPEKSRYDDDADGTDNAMEYQSSGSSQPARKDSLRQMQVRCAEPIISHITTHIWPGVELNPALNEDSILPTPQPEMTTHVIRGWISGLPAFELAGMERGVLATKSLCVATRLVVEWSGHFAGGRGWSRNANIADGGQSRVQPARFSIEDAAEACSLEVRWQTGMWGEVEDSHDVDKEVNIT